MIRPPSALRVLIVGILVLALSPLVFADIPTIVSYQGKVTDTGGTPVPTAAYEMQFSIHDAVTGGSELWNSGATAVDIVGGIFNILLGESPQPAIELPFDQDYWLEVVVESDIQGPRQHLGSVGYAYMASGLVPGTEVIGEVTTDTKAAIKGTNTATMGSTFGLYGKTSSTLGHGVHGYATATEGYADGVYGITSSTDGKGVHGVATATSGIADGVLGSTSSTEGRGVYGEASATVGNTRGVWGESASPVGVGVYGYCSASTNAAIGVWGMSESTDGMGVLGLASASTGFTTGVYGKSLATDGRGVYGEASATTGGTYGGRFETYSTSGTGVYGEASATEGSTYGVYGKAASTLGHGVHGYATATEGYADGVYGITSSTDGIGVHGVATATSGIADGVYGSTSSTDGRGVYGEATATTGFSFGGWFESHSPTTAGVYGESPNIGVYGESADIGVYGMTNFPSGYAGYFDGDVRVTGSINKSACSFLIDHPLDPENRLLRHNCMESPEHLVVYRGKVKLDADGEAAVEMPEYFTALAREQEATVNLTPIGRPTAPGRYEFSYEWEGGYERFEIFGQPGREVAWMVMAERDDPVIKRLIRPVEEQKGPDNKFCDRGKLLDPVAYGYPESMGRDYERHEIARQGFERTSD